MELIFRWKTWLAEWIALGDLLTLWRTRDPKKLPLPTAFSPVTFTNARISSQNFLTFSFNPFAKLDYT